MANIIIMGPQGCGKGTHGEYIAERYNIPTISTGDLFRYNMSNNTSLGKLAKTFIDKGELVPNEVTVSMLQERLVEEDCQKGFILDGFPRTVEQAKLLDKFMTEQKNEIDLVMFMSIPREESEKRIQGRITCRDCSKVYNKTTYFEEDCEKCGGELYVRDDDTDTAIKKRLDLFEKETLPVADHYKEKGILVTVDMMGSVAENRVKIVAELDELDKKLATKNNADKSM